jgi:hypothetical protein
MHFGSDTLVMWECTSYIGSEVYLQGGRIMIMLGCRQFLSGADHRANTCRGGKVSSVGVQISQVKMDSEWDLTSESDRLPAKADLPKSSPAGGGKPGRYYAGLLDNLLVEQLDCHRNRRVLQHSIPVTEHQHSLWRRSMGQFTFLVAVRTESVLRHHPRGIA